jgi:hypothetical protein
MLKNAKHKCKLVDDRYTDLIDARTYNMLIGVTTGIVGVIIVLTIVSLKVLSI